MDADEQIFSNFTSAYETKILKEAQRNTPVLLKTNDRGWYQRIKSKIDDKVSGYEELVVYNCYSLIQLSALVIMILWPTVSVLSVCAAKNESFILMTAVILLIYIRA